MGRLQDASAEYVADKGTPGDQEGAPEEQQSAEQQQAAGAPSKKQRRRKSGEEPIQLVKDSWILDGITEFFGLAASFPIRQQLVSRSGIKDDRGTRRIYFVSSGSSPCLDQPRPSSTLMPGLACSCIWTT